MSKSSVVRAPDNATLRDCWWGIHYDARGIERERKTFPSREKARAWVKAQKARERGDLTEAAE